MRSFAQVDVFTQTPGLGNPVAVVLDADGLEDDAMRRFANWTNLSETTFVLPSTTADYRLRIFTTEHELPFAGHPTLGTAQALLDAGRLSGRSAWVQECGAGLVEVQRADDGVLSFAAPAATVGPSPLSDEQQSQILPGAAPDDVLLVEVGPRWITGRMDVAALDALRPDGTALMAALDHDLSDGITLYAVDDAGQVHVRSFFAGPGSMVEDPVCGSGNAAVAVHLTHTGRTADVPPVYAAHQGKHRGREGQVTVTLGDPIRVGGHAVTVVSGTLSLA